MQNEASKLGNYAEWRLQNSLCGVPHEFVAEDRAIDV